MLPKGKGRPSLPSTPDPPSRSGTRRLELSANEEETKTKCPACKGSTYSLVSPIKSGIHKTIACFFCGGEGMVTASRAEFYRRLQGLTSTKG